MRIALDLIGAEDACAETINVASPHSNRMLDIVHAMEQAMDTPAVFDIVDKGSRVQIDTSRIAASARRCAIAFGDAYLGAVVGKYYGESDNEADFSLLTIPPSRQAFACPAAI